MASSASISSRSASVVAGPGGECSTACSTGRRSLFSRTLFPSSEPYTSLVASPPSTMNPTNASTSCRDAGKWCPPACVQTSASSNQSAHSSDAAGGTASSASPAITSARADRTRGTRHEPGSSSRRVEPEPARIFIFSPARRRAIPRAGTRPAHNTTHSSDDAKDASDDSASATKPRGARRRRRPGRTRRRRRTAARAPVRAERREDRVPSSSSSSSSRHHVFNGRSSPARREVDGGVRERDDRVRDGAAERGDVRREPRLEDLARLAFEERAQGGGWEGA